ncbi:hypothetical protein HDU80_000474 [Chytriomyces hyalinus]|nr:hypothetical protein HDU80_000474 [Chytriomyces hyalinus]
MDLNNNNNYNNYNNSNSNTNQMRRFQDQQQQQQQQQQQHTAVYHDPYTQEPHSPQYLDQQQQQQQQSSYYNHSYAEQVPEMVQTDSPTSWFSYIPSQVSHLANSLPAAITSIPIPNISIPSFFGGSKPKDLPSHTPQSAPLQYGQQQDQHPYPTQYPQQQHQQAQPQQPLQPHYPQQQQQQQQPQSRFQTPRSISDTFFSSTPNEENPSATNSRRSIRRTLSTYLFTDSQSTLPTTTATTTTALATGTPVQSLAVVETVTHVVGGVTKRVSTWALHGKNATLRMAGYDVHPEQALRESERSGLQQQYGGSYQHQQQQQLQQHLQQEALQYGSSQHQEFNGYHAGLDVGRRF